MLYGMEPNLKPSIALDGSKVARKLSLDNHCVGSLIIAAYSEPKKATMTRSSHD